MKVKSPVPPHPCPTKDLLPFTLGPKQAWVPSARAKPTSLPSHWEPRQLRTGTLHSLMAPLHRPGLCHVTSPWNPDKLPASLANSGHPCQTTSCPPALPSAANSQPNSGCSPHELGQLLASGFQPTQLWPSHLTPEPHIFLPNVQPTSWPVLKHGDLLPPPLENWTTSFPVSTLNSLMLSYPEFPYCVALSHAKFK